MSGIDLRERIEEITGRPAPGRIEVVTDTTEFMSIIRGHVIRLGDSHYLVEGDMREGRFGLDEEPKFWVKKAVDLDTGAAKILKLVFPEEFQIRIGLLRIRCVRDPAKESAVLDLVRGDPTFMQGHSIPDERGNLVRVIDYIRGRSLYRYLTALRMDHETYFRTLMPEVLRKALASFRAIADLNERGLCHGDIRNDHLIIDAETGQFRWIDFDLLPDVPDFDLWSLGNVLLYAVGKGEHTFHDVATRRLAPADNGATLTEEDASAFFVHRILNLRKLFPYVPEELNEILMHFSYTTTHFYETATGLVRDLEPVVESLDAAGIEP